MRRAMRHDSIGLRVIVSKDEGRLEYKVAATITLITKMITRTIQVEKGSTMANQIALENFRTPLLKCLDETFSNVHGIYLDKNTTLFQTLDSISAAEASERISSNSATI